MQAPIANEVDHAPATLEIGGLLYAVEAVPTVRLAKYDGTAYLVRRSPDTGRVECTCPDYEHRAAKTADGLCKHGAACVAAGLVDAPAGP